MKISSIGASMFSVLRLRRKLEIDPNASRMIQTKRGIGYVFALPVERF